MIKLLLLTLCSSLFAEQYIISYSSAVRNSILLNEKISVSKAMTECEGVVVGDSISLKHKKNNSLRTTIRENRTTFDTFVQKLPFSIRSYETIDISHINSLLILKMPPSCFTVNFNEDFVTIAPIKSKENQ